jgi:phosphoglycerate kinase
MNAEISPPRELRFHPEERADNRPSWGPRGLAEVYVNDAFGASHRAHASVVGVPEHLPAWPGPARKEVDTFSASCRVPNGRSRRDRRGQGEHKLEVLENIVSRVDRLLIGGGMAATFLASRGYGTGLSHVETDRLDAVGRLEAKAAERGVRLLLPRDVVVAEKLEAGTPVRAVPATEVPEGWFIADIGPGAADEFGRELAGSRTVIWNGPMGVFEVPEFAEGTRRIAAALANLEGTTVIGGGSTTDAVVQFGLADRMTHVSTGGGAALTMLAGKPLPGVEALDDVGEP